MNRLLQSIALTLLLTTFSQSLFSQSVSIQLTATKDTVVGLNNESESFNIVINEGSDAIFDPGETEQIYNILIIAPIGMVFSDVGEIDETNPSNYSDLPNRSISTTPTLSNPTKTIELGLLANAKLNTDEIIITGVKLYGADNIGHNNDVSNEITVRYKKASDSDDDYNTIGINTSNFWLNMPGTVTVADKSNNVHCEYETSIGLNVTFSNLPDDDVINYYNFELAHINGTTPENVIDFTEKPTTAIHSFSIATEYIRRHHNKVTVTLKQDGVTYKDGSRVIKCDSTNVPTNVANRIDIWCPNTANTFSVVEEPVEFKQGMINLWSLLKLDGGDSNNDISPTSNGPLQTFVKEYGDSDNYYYYQYIDDSYTGCGPDYVAWDRNPYRFEVAGESNYDYLNGLKTSELSSLVHKGITRYQYVYSSSNGSKNSIMNFNAMGVNLNIQPDTNIVFYKEIVTSGTNTCIAQDEIQIQVIPEPINIKNVVCATSDLASIIVSRNPDNFDTYKNRDVTFERLQMKIGNEKACEATIDNNTDNTCPNNFYYIENTLGTVNESASSPRKYNFNPKKIFEYHKENPVNANATYVYVDLVSIGSIEHPTSTAEADRIEVVLSTKTFKISTAEIDPNGLYGIVNDTMCPADEAMRIFSDFDIVNAEGRAPTSKEVFEDTSALTKAFLFNPAIAYQEILNDNDLWGLLDDPANRGIYHNSITYDYIDNNGCPGSATSDYYINANVHYPNNGIDIAGLEDHYCPSNVPNALIGNNQEVYDVTGNGVIPSGKDHYKFDFVPKLVFDENGVDIFTDTVLNTTLDVKYYTNYDSKICPAMDNIDLQVGSYYVNGSGTIIDYITDTSGALLDFDSVICFSNNNYKLLTNVDTLIGIEGFGVYSVSGEYNYNADTAIRREYGINNYLEFHNRQIYNSTISDTLSLSYKDINGCPWINTFNVTINSSDAKKNGWFSNLEDNYCSVDNYFPLKPNNIQIDSVIGAAIDTTKGNGFYYNPNYPYISDSNSEYFDSTCKHITDSVVLYYRDNNGCYYYNYDYVEIHAQPKLDIINISNLCFNDSTDFYQEISVDRGILDELLWNFGDDYYLIQDTNKLVTDSIGSGVHNGNTIGFYNRPKHIYNDAGKYPITVRATTTAGCEKTFPDTVIIGAYPELEIIPSSYNNTDTVTFNNNTTQSKYDDPIVSYTWNMDDPLHANTGIYDSISPDTVLTHHFAQIGVHNIELSAITNNGCETIDTFPTPSFPVIVVDGNRLFSTKFNNGEDTTGWIPVKLHKPELNSVWEHDTVSGIFVDDKHPVGSNMWITGHSDTINEKGWLETPTFNISELTFPVISLDIFQSLEPARDGAVLQYTTNDGGTWQTLGEEDGGSNWYNHQGISTNPGVFEFEPNSENEYSQGWSVDSSSWVTARYKLDGITNKDRVRFRIAYSSNDYRDSAKYLGFAVTNFAIGQRKRVALVEEFINSEYENHPEHKGFTTYTDTTALNDFVDSNPVAVVDVRYHYKFLHYTDPLYTQLSWWDVSVRSTETVTKEPFWIMDNDIRSSDLYGNVNPIDYSTAHGKRALVPPSFNIENIQTTLEDGKLKVSADFTKIGTYFDDRYGAHKIWVRYMIIQKKFAEGNTIHRNVMVEMLPSGPGNLAGEISDTIAIGQTQTITQLWDPLINTIGNEYRLVIAAYAWKDGKVHEVEQVAFKDIPTSEVPQIQENRIAKEGEFTPEILNGENIVLYPNPTDSEITILLPSTEDSELPIQWTINSMSSKTALTGSAPAGTPTLNIPVHNIADGMYIITINDGAGKQYIKKFTVLH